MSLGITRRGQYGACMRTCSICGHRRLAQIDQALLKGQAQAVVARRFAVSPDAINRHAKHIQSALMRAQAKQDGDELRYGDKLLREIDRIRQDAERLQEDSEQRRDLRAALRAIHERLAVVELEAKLSGQIKPAQSLTINVHAPEPLEQTLADAQLLLELHGYRVERPAAPPQLIDGVAYQHPKWCQCEQCHEEKDNEQQQVFPPANQ